MHTLKTTFAILLLLTGLTVTAQTKQVSHFTKVIISPYIQATFVEGNEESVTINDLKVDESKLHIEVNGETLRVYLEGAKDFPKEEKDKEYKTSHDLYQNTSATVTVTYKTLTDLSLRGEETQLVKSPINTNRFTLRIYGESDVTFNELNVSKLETTIYGESKLNIKAGTAQEQYYTCYGEGEVNSLSIKGKTGRVIAYGEADIKLNVSDRIKITAYGDAKLHYKGNPEIVKGLHFGDMVIDKMD